jgi:hypothetical protein
MTMNEAQAKQHLRRMLRSLTPGSILHLLADLFREDAEKAAAYEDSMAYERCKTVECTLYVVGLGIDAACPR